MPSFNSVLRRYTPPTCTLEITAKSSPLSKWTGKSAIKQLRFQLNFDAPQLPEEKQVTIRGDAQALEDLHQAVTNYVQDFVKRSPAQLNAVYFASEADAAPAPSDNRTEIVEVKTKLQSETSPLDDRALPTPQTPLQSEPSPDRELSYLPSRSIYLTPRGLVSHDLYLGPLATPESGSVINLGTLQLFDLATALDSYAADLMTLPNLDGAPRVKTSPAWVKVAAIALVTVGLTASALKLLYPTESEMEVASPTVGELSQNSLPEANRVSPAPPPPVGSPAPTPQAGRNENQVAPTESNRQQSSTERASRSKIPQSPGLPESSSQGQQLRETKPSSSAAPSVPPVPPPLGNTTPPPIPEIGVGDRPPAAPSIPDVPDELQAEFEIIPTESEAPPSSDPAPKPQPELPDFDDSDNLARSTPESSQAAAPGSTPMPSGSTFDERESPSQETPPKRSPDIPAADFPSDEPPPLPNVRIEPSPQVKDPDSLITTAEGIDDIAVKAPTGVPSSNRGREMPNEEIASAKIPSEEPDPLANPNTESLFNEPPQLAEAKDYFQQRWNPPADFPHTLQYILEVNSNGSVQQIVPVSEASKTHVDISGIPLMGDPFVSPFSQGQRLQIRVVLEPDGKVQTFAAE